MDCPYAVHHAIVACSGQKGLEDRTSHQHIHSSVFCPPSYLIGSCFHPPLPNLSSFFHSLPFSILSLFLHKSDHSCLRCTVTMATLYSAAGPHPLPPHLLSLPPSLSPIICSDSMVLNIDGGVLHPDPALLSASLLCLPCFLTYSPLFITSLSFHSPVLLVYFLLF